MLKYAVCGVWCVYVCVCIVCMCACALCVCVHVQFVYAVVGIAAWASPSQREHCSTAR
jgi:hypothetical protein